MTEGQISLYEKLSRSLVPVDESELGALTALHEALDIVADHLGSSSPTDDAESEGQIEPLAARTAMVDGLHSTMREILASRKLRALVIGQDGSRYWIPDDYWPSFHGFRPVAGSGFCSDDDHGILAKSLDGAAVFVLRDALEDLLNPPADPEFHADRLAKPGATSVPWTGEEMTNAIRASELTNRDEAWRTIFGPQRSHHGWDVNAFRAIWAEARGTKGLTGRPPKRA